MLQDEFGFKGLNNIKFQCQAGSSILLTTYINENAGIFYKDRYDYNGLWFALGVVADFDKIFSSKLAVFLGEISYAIYIFQVPIYFISKYFYIH